jgi:hypothetical protein
MERTLHPLEEFHRERKTGMNEPLEILNRMDGVRAETLKRLEALTQTQLDWKPSQGDGENQWSLGEVFMHLAMDEHYLREQIARPLLEGVKPPEAIHFIPPPPPHGARKEVIEFWFDRARAITRHLLENVPADANLELKHEGGLALMNGLEWFEGYARHEAFHHKQIDELLQQVNDQHLVGSK